MLIKNQGNKSELRAVCEPPVLGATMVSERAGQEAAVNSPEPVFVDDKKDPLDSKKRL